MTPVQILLLSAVGMVAAIVIQAVVRRRIGRPAAALWLAVVAVGAMAIVAPDSTTVVARWLGIHRGADLLLYALAIVVLQGFLLTYLRLRRVRRELTLLVRRLALLEGGDPDSTDGTRSTPKGPNQPDSP